MDTIELREKLDPYVHWHNGGGFQQVEMLINDIPLIEIIRQKELPYAEQEWDRRVAEGETEKEVGSRGSLAGDYMYLSSKVVYPPSKNFFGQAYNHGFLTEPEDPANYKSLILQCTCGITDCWFLVADITVGKKIITWKNFQQFHRKWTYDNTQFTFDYDQYLEAFKAT